MIKSIEEVTSLMQLVYDLNPDKTEEEIDAVIKKGMKQRPDNDHNT